MDSLSNIQKWYTGRNVLVTGGTGFMGKVLLEKMLRSLPTVGKIFVLVRPKRGQMPQERLEKMKTIPLFERLQGENPEALEKLIFLEGNLSEEFMGLSEDSIKQITDGVSVVFHIAATLRLEAEVKDAVNANVLATKQVMELCTKIKKLESVIHVSTAFCHSEEPILEEMVYMPSRDPYEMIKLVETESEEVLIKMKEQLISPHPNSYVFTKNLAEKVVADYEKLLPLTIARPSIVIPAFKEPMPGWVDSLNGAVGVLVAGGKGVLRSMLCKSENNADVIPVDLAINGLIFLSYYRAIMKEKKVLVSNVVSPRKELDITWQEVIDKSRKIVYKYPFDWMLWYPGGICTKNPVIHWLMVILFQWLPAILLDAIFFLVGKERFMIRVQKKIMLGTSLLQYFTMKKWDIRNDGSIKLIDTYLVGEDRKIFQLNNVDYDVDSYLTLAIIGARVYCLKESLETLKYTRIHMRVLQALHYICIFLFWYYMAKGVLNLFGMNQITSNLNIGSMLGFTYTLN